MKYNEKTINLKERTVNVALKANTKKELDAIGAKKDSYDDIIRKLIRKYYQKVATEINEDMNRIILRKKPKRKINSIKIDEIIIKYSFNIPQKNQLQEYEFNIKYENVRRNNKETNIDYTQSPIEKILDYARIIEKIIQGHIDPLFKLERINFEKYDEKTFRSLFDLNWWERKFEIAGLSKNTFREDIKEKFIEFGAIE